MPMQRIIVATEGSVGPDRVVEAAAALVKALDSELLIVTIGGNFPAEEIRKLARAEGGVGVLSPPFSLDLWTAPPFAQS